MCFSETASFTTAAITGAIGIVALMRTTEKKELPLAATPVLFAVQQAVEGTIWHTLPVHPDSALTATLTTAFLLFAKVVWPAFVPVAALLVETDPLRRRIMMALVATGLAVAAYFLWSVLSHQNIAQIDRGHVSYTGGPEAPIAISIAYFIVTGLTAALSSFRTLRAFAAIVFIGSLISYFFYWESFSSVWCFFAAAASVVILTHFEQVRYHARVKVGC